MVTTTKDQAVGAERDLWAAIGPKGSNTSDRGHLLFIGGFPLDGSLDILVSERFSYRNVERSFAGRLMSLLRAGYSSLCCL